MTLNTPALAPMTSASAHTANRVCNGRRRQRRVAYRVLRDLGCKLAGRGSCDVADGPSPEAQEITAVLDFRVVVLELPAHRGAEPLAEPGGVQSQKPAVQPKGSPH